MPSVTFLRLSDASVICRVTYFLFSSQSAFLSYIGRQAAPALRRTIGFDMQYRTSDVAEHLGKYLSFAEHTSQGNQFELILTIKVETRHAVEGLFGSKFSAICKDCNYCGVMAAWSHRIWKFGEQFLRFLEKRPPYGKIFQILFQKFTWRHRLTLLCWNFVKSFSTENRRNRALFTWQKQNFACLSNCRYCTDRAQNLPGPALNNVLMVLQIACKLVHFLCIYSRTRERRFLPRRVFP